MHIEQALKTYANMDSDQPTSQSNDHDFPAGDENLIQQEATLFGTFKACAKSCLQELKMQTEDFLKQKNSLKDQQKWFGQLNMQDSFTNLIMSVDNQIRSAQTKISLVEVILEQNLKVRIAQLSASIEQIEKVKNTSSDEVN